MPHFNLGQTLDSISDDLRNSHRYEFEAPNKKSITVKWCNNTNFENTVKPLIDQKLGTTWKRTNKAIFWFDYIFKDNEMVLD